MLSRAKMSPDGKRRVQEVYFATEDGVAVTDRAMPTWFPRNRFAELCSAPNTYWGCSAFSARGISPHLEEHSYPHAGQSKDGLIPIESGSPVTRVVRGRAAHERPVHVIFLSITGW